MIHTVLRAPWIRGLLRAASRPLRRSTGGFAGSEDYWVQRYARGGDSGAGSYNELAVFKAEVLNRFVADRGVESVIEFGCGDGNQLRLAQYPRYRGYDVSPAALERCRGLFGDDADKSFGLVGGYAGERADLALSLDVIYHLVEDAVYEAYMRRLFDAANRFVIVYASNVDAGSPERAPHVYHREFTRWIEQHAPHWTLVDRVRNRHPQDEATGAGSFADFYVYERSGEPDAPGGLPRAASRRESREPRGANTKPNAA